MRKIVLFWVASCLPYLTVAAPTSAEERCSIATLHGTYISATTGTQAGAPVGVIVMAFFDGDGHALFRRKYSDKSEVFVKGTYRLAENCKAEVSDRARNSITYFVAPSGDSYVYVLTSGPVLAAESRRVSNVNLLGAKP